VEEASLVSVSLALAGVDNPSVRPEVKPSDVQLGNTTVNRKQRIAFPGTSFWIENTVFSLCALFIAQTEHTNWKWSERPGTRQLSTWTVEIAGVGSRQTDDGWPNVTDRTQAAVAALHRGIVEL
jgi:hypothetical protein